ncbi:MAG TPA: hypothetical protein PKN75_12640 [Bacteroidia bacterium]|nr:hypothetical protein [Bacteroidia bacterium]
MNISDINKYFNAEIPARIFFNKYATEIIEHVKKLDKKGSSSYLFLIDDVGERTSVSNREISKLCNDYINNQINQYELSYLADVLLLSDKIVFKNEEISDYLSEMTDEEVNGAFTKSKAKHLISELNDFL